MGLRSSVIVNQMFHKGKTTKAETGFYVNRLLQLWKVHSPSRVTKPRGFCIMGYRRCDCCLIAADDLVVESRVIGLQPVSRVIGDARELTGFIFSVLCEGVFASGSVFNHHEVGCATVRCVPVDEGHFEVVSEGWKVGLSYESVDREGLSKYSEVPASMLACFDTVARCVSECADYDEACVVYPQLASVV